MKAIAVLFFVSAALGSWISVSLDSDWKPTFSNRILADQVCKGKFNDTIESLGYGSFEVHTNGSFPDDMQAYCAGVIEGFLTYERIYQLWLNFRESTFVNDTQYDNVMEFTLETMKWTYSEIKANEDDPYWVQVSLVWHQLVGLLDGYLQIAPDNATLALPDLFLLNMIGDLDDLLPALARRAHKKDGIEVDDLAVSDDDQRRAVLGSHCSSIVKLTANASELFAAHDMWASFLQMLNIYKYYHFEFSNSAVLSNKISFSSYPGLLSSEDDFYITEAELVVMETTNAIFNMSIYDAIVPQTLMSWIRVILSNRMAASGQVWTSIMQKYNSGTYNNQWIIVDFKLFNKQTPLPKGVLWIGSQLPAYFESADVTHVLNKQGYWPSYNIPYFKTIFDKAGYPAVVNATGDYWTYDHCPRANIFRQRQGSVETIEDLQKLMRYNDWRHDPYSLNCPLNQIASRLDLAPLNGTGMCSPAAFGAINSKITSSSMYKKYSASIVAGPTHDTVTPFAWTDAVSQQFNNTKHYGQPNLFNFEWMTFVPTHIKN